MSFQIMEAMIARQPPESQAIIRALLVEIEELKMANRVGSQGKFNAEKILVATEFAASRCHTAVEETQVEAEAGRSPRALEAQAGVDSAEKCGEMPILKPTHCCRAARSCRVPIAICYGIRVGGTVIRPHVAEYQWHRLKCLCCGETTFAELLCRIASVCRKMELWLRFGA